MPADNFPHEIFRAYDIRGVVQESLTPELSERIGRALGATAREKNITQFALAQDGRLSSPAIAEALTRGILSSGCDVIDIGRAPTPTLYFAVQQLQKDSRKSAGVQVTGSHNPPEYNGMKIVLDKVALSGDALQDLKRRVVQSDFVSGAGSLRRYRALDDYRRKIAADVTPSRGLKVAVDCGNGIAGAVAPEVLRAIGCEVVELFCEVDGNFPNHHPDPSDEQNLCDLIRAVKKTGADFGVAFDGDADRLGVVSPDGEIIRPDRQMMLFAEQVLQAHPRGEIIFDVKCSRLLPRAITAAGGKAVMWKTGHSHIKNKLQQTGAKLAGEMSGHIFFNDRWGGFDDGIYAAARLCEIVAADSRGAFEVFRALPNAPSTPELRMPMREGEAQNLVRALSRLSWDDAEVNRLDGVRADFARGFGLVRASNTTPAVTMRFEADDADELARIQSRFREALLQLDGDLKLPF